MSFFETNIGILADMVGSGKTLMIIAFLCNNSIEFSKLFKYERMVVSATIC